MQELICEGEPLQNVLRLMVLATLTAGGIPKKYFDPLRREVLHTYGHENIVTLSQLQEAGARLARHAALLCFPPAHAHPTCIALL